MDPVWAGRAIFEASPGAQRLRLARQMIGSAGRFDVSAGFLLNRWERLVCGHRHFFVLIVVDEA
jgi:hypothetical protein